MCMFFPYFQTMSLFSENTYILWFLFYLLIRSFSLCCVGGECHVQNCDWWTSSFLFNRTIVMRKLSTRYNILSQGRILTSYALAPIMQIYVTHKRNKNRLHIRETHQDPPSSPPTICKGDKYRMCSNISVKRNVTGYRRDGEKKGCQTY